MRFRAYIIKTLRENLRDWKVLIFTLLFAPCFMFILYAAYGNTNSSYNIIIINNDSTARSSHSGAVTELLEKSAYPDGKLKYRITFTNSVDISLKMLKNKAADAVAIFPDDFSGILEEASFGNTYKPTKLKLYGDPRNSRYAVASILLLTDLDIYVRSVTHMKTPVELDETLIGDGKALTEFDFYVPGIIVLALLNVMFTAGASLIKEIEKGTMQRLVMSRLKTIEFLGAISITQVAFCLVSMILALIAALACGFRFTGSYWAVLLVGTVSGIGIMGFSMITVSFLRSVFDLMTVGVIPYFLVMFFAGIFFPLPPVQVAAFGENILRLNDLLPLSLSASALNKVLNFNAGIMDIGFELAGILVVSALYFIIGLLLFKRRHMRLL